jgi:hypothetical protein
MDADIVLGEPTKADAALPEGRTAPGLLPHMADELV